MIMKITKCNLAGLLIIETDIFRDHRGMFTEKYSKKKFAEHGFNVNFVQDNCSKSVKNVLRGLHYQIAPAQGKLVSVTNGAILDVAVDLRPDSETYGQYYAVELTSDNGKSLWIPAGFAHGFCNIGQDEADVVYKVDNFYNHAGDCGIIWNDEELGINWPINNPIISDKDQSLPSFKQYKLNPAKWQER